ncbi:MAG: hypothetical protein JW931_06200 [Methanomicrobiaceae archaeon]|nr:hypothetical protein [Methanomicrobiaceae archaeon]
MRRDHTRDGLTGLEMIITIAILLFFMYVAFSAIFGAVGGADKNEGGIIAGSVSRESEILVTGGASNGVQDTGGAIMGISLICEDPDPSVMGGCLIPVRLLTGSMGSIDMSTAKLTFEYGYNTETPAFTTGTSVSKSSWTIADTSHIIPVMQADEDIYLEPNEIFMLLVYPGNPVPAEKKFSITLSPKNATPLELIYMVPPSIRKQRIVELMPG